MSQFSRFKLAFKALHQLGPRQTGLYALYQFGLRSGHYQRELSSASCKLEDLNHGAALDIQFCLPGLPDRNRLRTMIGNKIDQLYKEADEIVNGSVRLFGGQPVPLELALPGPLENWSQYELRADLINVQDIKFIWEPGRFGWACKLAMAYHLSKDERYCDTFWRYTENFLERNPPYNGPHWSSAQESAIRLVAIAFALQVFAQSTHTTQERLNFIARSIAFHAERIPPTLVYARSQNNNHLITEALGLYTASAMLPNHPYASRWHKLGWKWLMEAFRTQISADGTYTQHSTNYHRLMLQAALWAYAVHDHSFSADVIPPVVSSRLNATTRWLWKLVDPGSGCVPNLGHNDGSNILPVTTCPYHDYRPVIHAAAQAFLGTRLVPGGPWDDMAFWLNHSTPEPQQQANLDLRYPPSDHDDMDLQPPHRIQCRVNGSWAAFHVEKYNSRPAHADQLHLDLWWHGYNLAQDPGTYLYNAPPPWENSLTSAFVHNTVVVNEKEFMLRASRFLYLDWAQGKLIRSDPSNSNDGESFTGQHNGYRKIGITHTRKVTAYPDGHWEIIDRLDGKVNKTHSCHLHWLLPDWEYDLRESAADSETPSCVLRIKSPHGWVTLHMGLSRPPDIRTVTNSVKFRLARAGKLLVGTETVAPIMGWTSPTYGTKIPALACIFEATQPLPIELKSEWILPHET